VMISKDAEPKIEKLISLLAEKKGIPMICIENRVELGKIVGVENVSSSGKVRSKGCAVAAIQDYCEQTIEAGFVQASLIKGISS